MASNIRSIMGALRTKLQGINGSGGYVNNLSGDDQVLLGEYGHPPRVPAVAVYPVGQLGTHGLQLGRYTRTMNFQIQGWVAATSDAPSERVMAACDLLDDVMTAIEADRKLSGTVRDLIFDQVTAFNGDEAGIPGFGVIVVNLQVTWNVNSGGGT